MIPLPSVLTPAAIEPEWVSKRSQMSAVLKKIDCVRIKSVVNRNGLRRYVIEVYEHTSKNRIPTNWTRQDPPVYSSSPVHARTPVARTERCYPEFADLRGQVYNEAHKAHDRTPCDFCKSVIGEVAWSDNKPGSFLKLLASEEKVVQTLATSVNVLLDMVKCNGEASLCAGQEKAPQVLHDFLFKPESTIA